jgi:hypothetical protein
MHQIRTLCAALAALGTVASATIIDLESPSLGALTHDQDWRPTNGFFSGGAFFNNDFQDFGSFTAWSGFALSRETDTTTAGFGNQYSAFAGSGFGGSSQFAVAYNDNFNPAPRIILPAGEIPLSIQITNITYAALSMRDGDFAAKKFGGTSGNDPDFFKLTIQGLNASNTVTGSVDFYLADYRFANNALDYIVNTWTTVDLSSLPATTTALQLNFTSSDVGQFGINTPTYAAVDQLITTVPEPASTLLCIAGLSLLTTRRRR